MVAEQESSMEWRLPTVTLDGFGEGELVDLDDRTAHILRMRSGMLDGQRHTLREVGDEVGLGMERVRQLENQGLTVIRRAREAQRHLRQEPSEVRYRWRVPRKPRKKRR